MAIGLRDHGSVDTPGSGAAGTVRALQVFHEDLAIIGRVDELVRDDDGWRIREYKSTPVRRQPTVTRAMTVQVALQALCLIDMGWPVSRAEIYFRTHNVTVPVALDEALFVEAMAELEATRLVVESTHAPRALEDDPRCRSCSHVEVCLPDERRLSVVRRRIRVSDPDSQVVYLTTPGSLAHVKKGRLLVDRKGDRIGEVPLERVQGVQVIGNVDLSSGLIRELLWRDLPIVWTKSSGRVVGWAISARSPNGGPRMQSRSVDEIVAVAVAKEMVRAKISNQATLARRLSGDADSVKPLRRMESRVLGSVDRHGIFSWEGAAAAHYFGLWRHLVPGDWPWEGRRTRGATDPVNVALNFVYALLTGDAVRSVALCGLDPHAGVLHSSNRNKPALALDVMEEFRAPIADSVVLNAFRRNQLRQSDFVNLKGSTRLGAEGRRVLIRGFERRMQEEFKHPVFGYRVSWRRALEVQARQVLGVLDGSQPNYRGIRIR